MQRAAMALDVVHAAREQRRFDVFEHGEPRKQREALKYDGDVRGALGDRLAVPEDFSGSGRRKSGKHAQQRGFAGARRAEHRGDRIGFDSEIERRDNLDSGPSGCW